MLTNRYRMRIIVIFSGSLRDHCRPVRIVRVSICIIGFRNRGVKSIITLFIIDDFYDIAAIIVVIICFVTAPVYNSFGFADGIVQKFDLIAFGIKGRNQLACLIVLIPNGFESARIFDVNDIMILCGIGMCKDAFVIVLRSLVNVLNRLIV